MPEFIAVGRSTGKVIEQATQSMMELVGNPEIRQRQKTALQQLSRQYGQPGASQRAAKIIATDLRDRLSNQPSKMTMNAA